MSQTLAVVGATGLVGEQLVRGLAARGHRVRALATEASVGQTVTADAEELAVEAVEGMDFTGVQGAFLALPAEVSHHWGPRIAGVGCPVWDLSGAFLDQPDWRLIPDESMDPETLTWRLALPEALAVAAVARALTPMGWVRGIEGWVLTPASLDGRDAVKALAQQSIDLLSGRGAAGGAAFRVQPWTPGAASARGAAVRADTQGLLGYACGGHWSFLRMPAFFGLRLQLRLAFEEPVDAEAARECLSEDSSAQFIDGDQPFSESAEGDARYRLAELSADEEDPNLLHLGLAFDNVAVAVAAALTLIDRVA